MTFPPGGFDMLRIAQFHRKDLILNLINHFGPVSRTELITMTDLRPATVGDIIKELLDEKQIIQTGAVSGGHGRRRVMLEINREYLCAIGIAFTPGEVVCIISRTDGSIAEQAIIPAPSGISRHELCGRITLQVKDLLASNAERSRTTRYTDVRKRQSAEDSANMQREHASDSVHDALQLALC